jgi:hypothetical protein
LRRGRGVHNGGGGDDRTVAQGNEGSLSDRDQISYGWVVTWAWTLSPVQSFWKSTKERRPAEVQATNIRTNASPLSLLYFFLLQPLFLLYSDSYFESFKILLVPSSSILFPIPISLVSDCWCLLVNKWLRLLTVSWLG